MGTDGQRQRHIWCSPTSTCSSNREGHKDTRIPSLSHTTRSAFPRILPPNMATSSSRISYSTIFGTVAATVAASGLAYAVYFDYMRRNNVEFRRNLLKEQKKVAKQAHVEASKGKEATADALKNAVRQMKSEPVPTNVEEREAYFLEQVAIGEALAAKGPAFYVPAAISFFKGLQVYPQPQELLMIYSKTQPAEVVQLLMDALRISISEGEGSSSDSSSSASRTAGAPRGQAILEEIDTDDSERASQRATATADSESNSQSAEQNTSASSSTSSPATANSYVDVEAPSASSSAVEGSS